MTKRKFKEIEKNCEKSSQSPNRSNKRLKLSSGTDSERMITLSQKKVKTRLFEKTNLINKDALNKLKFNDDSPNKKFLVKIQVHKPQKPYSLTPKFLKKKKRKENLDIQREDILEKAKDVTIISDSACSSDLSYHQSFSTSLLDLF